MAGRGNPSTCISSDGGGGRQKGPSTRISSDRGGGGRQSGPLRSHFEQQRGWWQAEGTPPLTFRAMEGVAGREGPLLTFRATEGVVAGRGDPSTHISSDRGGGGRQRGPLRSHFE